MLTRVGGSLSPEVEAALRSAEELRLVTRGRRSGRAHTVTVNFAYEDGAVWLRTELRRGAGPDWYRNLRRDPRCRIEVAGQVLEARAEPVADRDAALRHAVRLLRAKYGAEWVSDWYVDFGREPVRIRLLAGPGMA